MYYMATVVYPLKKICCVFVCFWVVFFLQIHHFIKKETPKDFILYIVLYNNVLVCNLNLQIHIII